MAYLKRVVVKEVRHFKIIKGGTLPESEQADSEYMQVTNVAFMKAYDDALS